MNEGECLMFWVFCLIQVESFLQCIFSPYPWFTKNKHGYVVSYKLGNIMLDDAPFCFQTPCKSWSTTNNTLFIEMIMHLVSKCCRFLLVPNRWVLQYVEKQTTQLPLLIYNKKTFFSCFELCVQGCQLLQML